MNAPSSPETPAPTLPQRMARPVRDFLATETAGGIVLLGATVVALVWMNTPLGGDYERFWETEFALRLGDTVVSRDLRHWVNEGLMALFFLVVGLEIKRELVVGELNDVKKAALPAMAALGGMAVPAALYALLNAGGDGSAGWGIPMATDIAFALGLLALVSPRAPASLKLFLLTLAVVDDIGAILVIALFYSGGIELGAMAATGGFLGAMIGLRRLRIDYPPPYIFLGILAWLAMLQSGVHATVAGVAVGLIAPARAVNPSSIRRLPGFEESLAKDEPLGGAEAKLARQTLLEATPVTDRIAHDLHPWTSFVVVPIFALANAGVQLDGDTLAEASTSPIAWGIVLGLVVGKIVGITGATALAKRSGLGLLPEGVSLKDIPGVAAIAGIGFTVALFIATLAFEDVGTQEVAKIGVLVASAIAAGVGAIAARSNSDRATSH